MFERPAPRPLQRVNPRLAGGYPVLDVKLPAQGQLTAHLEMLYRCLTPYHHTDLDKHISPLIEQHWYVRQNVRYEVLNALHDIWAHCICNLGAASLELGTRLDMHCLLRTNQQVNRSV